MIHVLVPICFLTMSAAKYIILVIFGPHPIPQTPLSDEDATDKLPDMVPFSVT